jgi:hypothetical protein
MRAGIVAEATRGSDPECILPQSVLIPPSTFQVHGIDAAGKVIIRRSSVDPSGKRSSQNVLPAWSAWKLVGPLRLGPRVNLLG